jgi:predicted AlkP superfamily pyrophosphatase or phosphodiesterase
MGWLTMTMTQIFAAAVVGFAALAVSSTHASEPAKEGCVVLISVDGLAGFYLDDPRAELPTIRRLAEQGARADGLVCSFPTVTWPNHTTLVTGVPPARHGVIGNDYLDRNSGTKVPFIPDPLFDKDEIVRVPTIYDAAHRAGLVTAAVIWPATRNARTLDFTVPDMAGDDAWPKYGTARWLEELRRDGLPVDRHGTWVREPAGGVQRDWLYSRMAAHVLRRHRPNLLLVHLVELDHVQHKFGPRSDEAYWAVSYADDRVRDIVEAVQEAFGEMATIVVASDHGFFPIENDIKPNVLAKRLNLAGGDGRVRALAQGGACGVYVLDGDRDRILARLKEELTATEGIDVVLGAESFAELGQPTPEEDPRAPDLWLSAKSGYAFSDSDAGDEVVTPRASRAGTHGYLPDQPEMHGSLVLAGRGVRPEAKLGKVSNLDIAPTMARLLGVALPTADGRVLEAALTSP